MSPWRAPVPPTCFTALAGNWTSQMPGWSRTCGFHKGLEIGEPSRPFPESSSHETPCSWTVLLKNSNSPLGLRIGRSQLLTAATTVTRIVSRRKRTTSPNMKSPTRFTPGPGRTATHLTSLPGCRQDTRGVRTYVSPFLFASSHPRGTTDPADGSEPTGRRPHGSPWRTSGLPSDQTSERRGGGPTAKGRPRL